jgi:hypothetical protein
VKKRQRRCHLTTKDIGKKRNPPTLNGTKNRSAKRRIATLRKLPRLMRRHSNRKPRQPPLHLPMPPRLRWKKPMRLRQARQPSATCPNAMPGVGAGAEAMAILPAKEPPTGKMADQLLKPLLRPQRQRPIPSPKLRPALFWSKRLW